MTLIAFAAHRDRAEIITDTRTYAQNGVRMGHHSKLMSLHHLDAAVLAQGSTGFEARAHVALLDLARHCADFDGLLTDAPTALLATWRGLSGVVRRENAASGARGELANSMVFLVGYSAAAAGFVAVGHGSDFDFDPMPITGVYAMPSPLDRRPGPLELHRLVAHLRRNADRIGDGSTEQVDQAVAQLQGLPAAAPVPRKPADWVDLAKLVRQHRAMADVWTGFKTIVGGDVHLTVLRRGSSSTKRIHTFNDSGAEFAKMMYGTLHPTSQAAPCVCGSRRRYVDCCLDGMHDQPCPCGSGRLFARCCSIDAPLTALVDAVS